MPARCANTAPAVESGLLDVNSPIVGTFYAAPSPDAPPYVELGSRVRKGQVLAVVRADALSDGVRSARAAIAAAAT